MKADRTRSVAAPVMVALSIGALGSALFAQGPRDNGRDFGGRDGFDGGPRGGRPEGPRGEHGFRDFDGGPMDGALSPQEHEAAMAQRRERGLRRMLAQNNITDEKVIGSIANFVSARETATRALRQKARIVGDALRDPDATGARIAPLLADLRASAASERNRRRVAERALDNAIGWSRNARLEAALTLAGFIGEEASTLDGAMGGPGGRERGGPNRLGRGERGGFVGGPPPMAEPGAGGGPRGRGPRR